ncbi:MAG: NAD-dependent DNA ligase LigA [Lachnospiraceae bacterium]|nr:NAD-dependent DNA ligase LigA [Lachnospiraceae bacterium]
MNDRMRELVDKLNEASRAYYAKDVEIMSNYEYDKLYDELVNLEAETGITLSDSPTVNVGYESVDFLPKEAHEKPMLSLSKTKDRAELHDWVGEKEAILSWKLDGLTIVLTYKNGDLYKAVTRGNGEVGEVITANARTFKNIPLKISYKGDLIVRGEAVITYSDFEKINAAIIDADSKYKNPRNLCSGSVRQLDSSVTANRNVRFYAFSLVSSEDIEFNNSFENQFKYLKGLGFDVVEYKRVNKDNILETIEWFAESIETNNIPSDGLVLTYDDIAYGASLGRTAKFPRNAIAFKWQDEIKETILREIEWSPSRTGLINPVAIFDTIDLEGTNVSRASLHNISYVEDLKLGIGDRITVYKANMIIPQIAENITRSGNLTIPSVCPVCGGATEVRQDSDTKMLYCSNTQCAAKKIKSFSHFVERNAMNIEGLSEATLEKFISLGFIKDFVDIYKLETYRDKITNLEGFGEKSYENIIASINASRECMLYALINALGIPGIGSANAKLLCKAFDNDLDKLLSATVEDISAVEGMGEILATGIVNYMQDEKNLKLIDELRKELNFIKIIVDESTQVLAGKTFVITGSLNNYVNRDELKSIIEEKGGKVSGSVSAKTTALINNDATSNSSKNKKAKELGVEIITEAQFEEMYLA